jgi:hypothetical protein
VSSLDTASSTTYVNPDGSRTLEASASPIRVKTASGWTPVDMTLVTDLSGVISPKSSPVGVTLGGAGSTQIAQLSAGGGSVSYGWPAGLPAPTLSGSTANYANVQPGVDLVVAVSTSGFETSFVYKTAQAASAWGSLSLPLTVSGLTASVSSTGAVSYVDSSGSTVARTPAPKAWDSRKGGTISGPGVGPVDPAGGAVRTASGAKLSATSSPASGSLVQQLQVPSALLSDSATVYPIVVDPSITDLYGENHSGYVENDGDVEYDSTFDGGRVHVGTFDGGTTRTRGLFSFAQNDSKGAVVSYAKLELGSVYSWSCTAKSMTVYKSSPFSSSVTWSTATLATTANAVSRSFADGYSSSCPAQEQDYVVTDIVNDAANDGTSNYYLQLRAGSETDSTYWKKFQYDAALVVTYNHRPSTPTSPGFSTAVPTTPSCVRGSSRPSIDATQASSWKAKVTDSDPGNSVKAQFRWWDLATPGTTHTATSGFVKSGDYAKAAFAGGTTTFLDGHNYGFTVRAYDGVLYSSNYTSGDQGTTSCEFHVADPAPNNPTSLKFAQPSLPCPPGIAVRGDIAMQFSAYVSDPDATYGKTVRAVFTVTVSGSTKWTWTSPYGGNRAVASAQMPANTVANHTTFTWSVRAYNAQKYSATTPTCTGTTDNGVPVPPTVSSGGVFGTPGSPAGYVGDSDTITLASTDAVKFVWVQTDDGAATNLQAGACGSVTSGVHTVCSSQGADWDKIKNLRAMEPEFTITAAAYNSAGTSSNGLGSQTFDVNEYPQTHAWLVDNVPDGENWTSVPDAPFQPTTSPAPLTLSASGASWVSSSYPGEDTDPNAPTSGPTLWGTALEFDGTGNASANAGTTTPTLTVDMTHSFSIGVWVRPTVASSTSVADVAMADDGSVNSGFFVGQYANYWMFCMSHTQNYTGNFDGDCAYVAQPTNTADYVGQWTFLAATWDSQAQQMQLYVNGSQTGNLATASHTTTAAASGAITIGSYQHLWEYPSWRGDILNPVTYQGILDADQLTDLTACGLPQDLNAGCAS